MSNNRITPLFPAWPVAPAIPLEKREERKPSVRHPKANDKGNDSGKTACDDGEKGKHHIDVFV